MSLSLRNPDIYYGGALRRRRRVVHRRRRIGAGFFSSLGNALKGAANFAKEHKIISTVGNALGAAGIPLGGTIGGIAESLGYGRRRRRVVHRHRGGALEQLLGMGRKRRVVHRRRGGALDELLGMGRRRKPVRRHHGRGFLSSLGSALSKANDFAKSSGIVSKVLSATNNPNAAAFASKLGYGLRRRRRVVHRRRRGAGFFSNIGSALSKANDFAKSTGIASKILSAAGHPNASAFASKLGYGLRRRRRVVHRRHRGGANFFSTLNKLRDQYSKRI